MAIAWLSVLKSVPWGDVISHAPKVADGAKKLWGSVARKAPGGAHAGSAVEVPTGHQAPSMSELEVRLAAAESAAADLHQQMLVSSELIKELADQNAQLIARIESQRVRVLWLAGATLVCAGVAVTALVLALDLAG